MKKSKKQKYYPIDWFVGVTPISNWAILDKLLAKPTDERNKLIETEEGYEFHSLHARGNHGLVWSVTKYPWAKSELENCDWCKRLFNKKWLRKKSFAQYQNKKLGMSYEDGQYGTFCIGCWNKVEAYNRKFFAVVEINIEIQKATREIAKWQKVSNHQENCVSSSST